MYEFEIVNPGEWVIAWDMESDVFYPGRVVHATCQKCGRERVRLVPWKDAPHLVPKENIGASSMIFAFVRCYKSNTGASYSKMHMGYDPDDVSTHGTVDGWYSRKSDITSIDLPKGLGLSNSLDNLPSCYLVSAWDCYRVVYSRNLHQMMDAGYTRHVKSLCLDCCREIILEQPEKITQGSLTLVRGSSIFDDTPIAAVYQKIIGRGTATDRLYNHSFPQGWVLGNFVALDYSEQQQVEAEDHEPIVLEPGCWVGYHPEPSVGD